MTTTELYSGYTAEGKPSSRVLRPPGGGSSNIFGGAEPTPQQQVRQQMPAQEQNQSPSNPTTDAKQAYQKNKPSGKVKYNPITGEEYPADYGQKMKNKDEEEQEKEDEESDEKQNDNAESSNTPDENNSSEEKPTTAPAPAEQAPSPLVQKVRQPPGGKSSGLW